MHQAKEFIERTLIVFFGLFFPLEINAIEVPRPTPEAQTSKGKQSPNQINKNGNNLANYGNIFQGPIHIGGESVAKKNSYEEKQEALFLVEHPTTLQVTSLRWTSWFNDPVPFLDVEIANNSPLPALDVQVSLLNNKTGSTLSKLKPYQLSESYTMKLLKGSPITINGNSKWRWPLLSQTEAESIIHTKCIVDAGLDFQPLRTDWTTASGKTYIGGASAVLIKIKYKTIFGQKFEFIVTGVIDTASRKSEYMIPRGSTKEKPLKCVGDENWDSIMTIGGELTN